MKKAKATRLLSELELQQYKESVENYYDGDWRFMDFITVYYNIGVMKNLRYCNTVNDALEVVEALPSISIIALEIGDEFKE